jgi:hypothetical protein
MTVTSTTVAIAMRDKERCAGVSHCQVIAARSGTMRVVAESLEFVGDR